MDRVGMKLEAKRIIGSHFPFFILLFLPAVIIQLGYSVAYSTNPLHEVDTNQAFNQIIQGTAHFGSNELLNLWLISTLISIVSGLLLSGMMFVCIDLIRNKVPFDQPVTRSFTILNHGQYFIGAIMIGIITTVLTLLWSVLLIVPGIIKGFAYSQALNIYRDSVDAGKPIGYLEAITRSRKNDGRPQDGLLCHGIELYWLVHPQLVHLRHFVAVAAAILPVIVCQFLCKNRSNEPN